MNAVLLLAVSMVSGWVEYTQQDVRDERARMFDSRQTMYDYVSDDYEVKQNELQNRFNVIRDTCDAIEPFDSYGVDTLSDLECDYQLIGDTTGQEGYDFASEAYDDWQQGDFLNDVAGDFVGAFLAFQDARLKYDQSRHKFQDAGIQWVDIGTELEDLEDWVWTFEFH